MNTKTDILTLEELRAFDPDAPTPQGRTEWRFCCPLFACAGKPRTREHRSMAVNATTGGYHCHRCGASGKLREYWTEHQPDARRSRMSRRKIERERVYKTLEALQPPPPDPIPAAADWKQKLHGLQRLEGTPGAQYLENRGIPAEIAASCAKYSEDFLGKPSVVFPLRDLSGHLTAAQGRRTEQNASPKVMTAGHMKEGVFLSTADVLEYEPLIITEAPIDALSLAVCGIPAIALCGITLRPWLSAALAFRTVYLAFDSDEAGDNAAIAWNESLRAHAADVKRLRPVGGKDWNEMLLSDLDALRKTLANLCDPWND